MHAWTQIWMVALGTLAGTVEINVFDASSLGPESQSWASWADAPSKARSP